MDKPFFSEKLLRIAPDGTYRSFAGSDRIAVYQDRLEIGAVKVYSPCLRRVSAKGNVLHVVYSAADGRQVESYYRYDTLLPAKAHRALAELSDRLTALLHSDARPGSANSAGVSLSSPGRLAERLEGRKGRTRIAVYSPRVSFPALCPSCARPPTNVATLTVSRNFENGAWFLPVCSEHSRLGASIHLENWGARSVRTDLCDRKQGVSAMPFSPSTHWLRNAASTPMRVSPSCISRCNTTRASWSTSTPSV